MRDKRPPSLHKCTDVVAIVEDEFGSIEQAIRMANAERKASYSRALHRWRVGQYFYVSEGSVDNVFSFLGIGHRLYELELFSPSRRRGLGYRWAKWIVDNSIEYDVAGLPREVTTQLAQMNINTANERV